MTETTNLKLKKPDSTDFYNVQDFNDNADILDDAVTELKNGQSDTLTAANDYTDEIAKTKASAQHTHEISDVNGLQTTLNTKANTTDIPTSLPANGGNSDTVNGYTVNSDVPSGAVFTDTKYTAGSNVSISSANVISATNTTYGVATTSANGLMSSSDKSKLDGVATGANAYTHPSYTARTGVPTANQTPAFGGTFSVSQPVSDATGHITAVNSRTVTIPSTAASASAAGLVTTGTQTFAGAKTFSGIIYPNGATAYGTPQARKLASGTAAATTTNCPSGAWYGLHE